jgi:hypothetical protein
VLLAGGFCAAAEAFWSVVLAVPAALCEPAPMPLDEVWLLTGGFAVG